MPAKAGACEKAFRLPGSRSRSLASAFKQAWSFTGAGPVRTITPQLPNSQFPRYLPRRARAELAKPSEPKYCGDRLFPLLDRQFPAVNGCAVRDVEHAVIRAAENTGC